MIKKKIELNNLYGKFGRVTPSEQGKTFQRNKELTDQQNEQIHSYHDISYIVIRIVYFLRLVVVFFNL